ncbi:MAG: vWA domain-containing protein [Limisphaerales bacterium]
MSFLTPWFLAGALAVAGPILFHLIRRAARERKPFSSLMFLSPTPPRTVRRRKLEHLVLLFLRCLCLLLLAAAFARPFFAKDIPAPGAADSGRQVVLLLDTSASMRRPGFWEKARAVANQYFAKFGPGDAVAVMTFDRQPRTLVSFSEWSSWPLRQRANLARARLAATSPGWMGTALGLALTTAADQFRGSTGTTQPASRREVVVISDLQESAQLEGLQGHDWPADTRVMIERVEGAPQSNAGLEILEPAASASPVSDIRVRVTNSRDSRQDKLHLGWRNAPGNPMEVYVPAGQTRTFQAPKLSAAMTTGALQLTGDDVAFDNLSYFAAPEVENVNIACVGTETAQNSAGLLYYLERVFPRTPRRKVQFATLGTNSVSELLATASFAFLSGPLAQEQCADVRAWLRSGKTALLVLTNIQAGPTLAALLGLPQIAVTEATGDYALLGEVDFRHPLFAPFDDPRFNDFTHIHFWKHRRLEIPPGVESHIVAKFDDGSPSLTQITVGKGTLLVLASGWNATDSQLAVSSKFPPLMETMLEWTGGGVPAHCQFRTGDAIPSPHSTGAAVQWQKPNGTNTSLPSGSPFLDTDTPGIYRAVAGGKEFQFAVNLRLEESRVAPLPVDELARLGVPLGTSGDPTAAPRFERQRQLQRAELESRQKLWRWLIVAALAITFGEVLLSGSLARRVTAREAIS